MMGELGKWWGELIIIARHRVARIHIGV